MIQVQSSSLDAYDYDANSQVLSIKFKKTPEIYDFEGVPAECVTEFEAAESKGSYFYKHIRGQFKFTKRLAAEAD